MRASPLPRSVTTGLLLASVALTPVPAESQDDPWATLRAARISLAEASPLEATFSQTYTPAGFSTGETEAGRLHLGLPECLRWDYLEPYPRSYLLCGETVWAWSPDESVGDRFENVSRDEAGLDFLLLSVERLDERYTVATTAAENGIIRLELTPIGDEAPFSAASILIDPATDRPVEIAYRDDEGNLTRFELTDFRDPTGGVRFTPPSGVEWVVNH